MAVCVLKIQKISEQSRRPWISPARQRAKLVNTTNTNFGLEYATSIVKRSLQAQAVLLLFNAYPREFLFIAIRDVWIECNNSVNVNGRNVVHYALQIEWTYYNSIAATAKPVTARGAIIGFVYELFFL